MNKKGQNGSGWIWIIIIIGIGFFLFKGNLFAVFPGQVSYGTPTAIIISGLDSNGNAITSFKERDNWDAYSPLCALDPIDMNRMIAEEGGTDVYNNLKNWQLSYYGDFIPANLKWKWMDNKPCFSLFNQPSFDCNLKIPGSHYVEQWYAMKGSGCSGYGFIGKYIDVAPLPCVLDSGQFIASQVFKAGDIFNKDTLALPVVKFCNKFPTKIVDAFTLLGDVDYSIYEKMENLQSITVPQGKVYEVSWVTNDPLASRCSAGFNYNYNLNSCTDTGSYSGIIQILTLPSISNETGLPTEEIIAVTTETNSEVTIQYINNETKEVIPVDTITITPENKETIIITSKQTGNQETITMPVVSDIKQTSTQKSSAWIWWVVISIIFIGGAIYFGTKK